MLAGIYSPHWSLNPEWTKVNQIFSSSVVGLAANVLANIILHSIAPLSSTNCYKEIDPCGHSSGQRNDSNGLLKNICTLYVCTYICMYACMHTCVCA